MQATDRLTAALADRYRIERPLGQGGMATVYLAEDLKHKRKVAVKVLKPELAAVLGADRFVQEITTTAAMSHPHILPLFDSGATDGFLYYVMPYVDGESLRDTLDRETQLGVDDAVRITREVADALEYAHSRGVIHRDIKPENILLQGGSALVADFGIALAVSAAAGGRMTETGLSLGTPHYMSPEQATAEKEITGRSDVYSLASVCYEMLTGQPPHLGGSAQQIIMKIITEPAQPVAAHRKSVPPNVAAAVAKALEKLPADRFGTARAFSEALNNPGFSVAHAAGGARASAEPDARARTRHIAIGLVAGGLVVGAAALALRSAPPPPEVVRFELTFAPGVRADGMAGETIQFAISPDGQRIVFATVDSLGAGGPLHLRALGKVESTPIPGTEGGQHPFFSPDGLWIGFTTQDDVLRKVASAGGPPITLARGVYGGAGLDWSDDGYIWYTTTDSKPARIPSAGGEPEAITPIDTTHLGHPHVLPGGNAVLYRRIGESFGDVSLAYFDVATKETRVLVPGAMQGWYLPPGRLLYHTSQRKLFVVPFDAASGEVRGEPTLALDGVEGVEWGRALFAVSRSGTALYVPGTRDTETQIVAVDRSGREDVIVREFSQNAAPRWSPTGERIAVMHVVADTAPHIWIYDIASTTFSQLVRDDLNFFPSWSPDGRRVMYWSWSLADPAGGLYWINSDGSGSAERVVAGEKADDIGPASWTPDGSRIVFDGLGADSSTGRDLFVVGTGSDRTRQVLLATADDEVDGHVSPDGRWLAYVSDEGGTDRVHVRPFLRDGGRWVVSSGYAVNPLWASDSELTYRDARGDVVSARLEMGPASLRVVSRTTLFAGRQYQTYGSVYANHDVSRDGQRFLMLRRQPSAMNQAAPVVIVNWGEEVRQRMQQQGAGRPRRPSRP